MDIQEYQRPRPRRANRKKSHRQYILITLVLFPLSFFLGYFAFAQFGFKPPAPANDTFNEPVDKQKYNILLLGTDERKGEKQARADTIMIAAVDKEKKEVRLLSIPRDTLVRIPGKKREDKINAAHAYGGAKLMARTIEEDFNIPIDYYVRVDFKGFRDIIDTLGGVEIDVEKRMRYYDPWDGTNINLYPGRQKLDGKKALDYVRFRHDKLGDLTRIQRQQKFLKALADEVLSVDTIFQAPSLIKQVVKNVDTNIPLSELLALAKVSRDFDTKNLDRIPGTTANINGGSYYKANPKETTKVVDQLLGRAPIEDPNNPENNVTENKNMEARNNGKKNYAN